MSTEFSSSSFPSSLHSHTDLPPSKHHSHQQPSSHDVRDPKNVLTEASILTVSPGHDVLLAGGGLIHNSRHDMINHTLKEVFRNQPEVVKDKLAHGWKTHDRHPGGVRSQRVKDKHRGQVRKAGAGSSSWGDWKEDVNQVAKQGSLIAQFTPSEIVDMNQRPDTILASSVQPPDTDKTSFSNGKVILSQQQPDDKQEQSQQQQQQQPQESQNWEDQDDFNDYEDDQQQLQQGGSGWKVGNNDEAGGPGEVLDARDWPTPIEALSISEQEQGGTSSARRSGNEKYYDEEEAGEGDEEEHEELEHAAEEATVFHDGPHDEIIEQPPHDKSSSKLEQQQGDEQEEEEAEVIDEPEKTKELLQVPKPDTELLLQAQMPMPVVEDSQQKMSSGTSSSVNDPTSKAPSMRGTNGDSKRGGDLPTAPPSVSSGTAHNINVVPVTPTPTPQLSSVLTPPNLPGTPPSPRHQQDKKQGRSSFQDKTPSFFSFMMPSLVLPEQSSGFDNGVGLGIGKAENNIIGDANDNSSRGSGDSQSQQQQQQKTD